MANITIIDRRYSVWAIVCSNWLFKIIILFYWNSKHEPRIYIISTNHSSTPAMPPYSCSTSRPYLNHCHTNETFMHYHCMAKRQQRWRTQSLNIQTDVTWWFYLHKEVRVYFHTKMYTQVFISSNSPQVWVAQKSINRWAQKKTSISVSCLT